MKIKWPLIEFVNPNTDDYIYSVNYQEEIKMQLSLKYVLLTKLIIFTILSTLTRKLTNPNPLQYAMPKDPKPALRLARPKLRIAQGSELTIERVRIPEKQISVEGEFTLPELARLSLEDQVFVVAFIRSHGTIKVMEQTFGVSYPTIKARLNRIAGQLEFVEVNPSSSPTDVLQQLNTGEISPADAIRALEALK